MSAPSANRSPSKSGDIPRRIGLIAGPAAGLLLLLLPLALSLLPDDPEANQPPSAVVYGSGRIEIGQMMRAGFWLNPLMTLLIGALALLLAPRLGRADVR